MTLPISPPRPSAFSREPSSHSRQGSGSILPPPLPFESNPQPLHPARELFPFFREGSGSFVPENKPRAIPIHSLLGVGIQDDTPPGEAFSMEELRSFQRELNRGATLAATARISHHSNSLAIRQLFPPRFPRQGSSSPINEETSPSNHYGNPPEISSQGSPPSEIQDEGISPLDQIGAPPAASEQGPFDETFEDSYSPEDLEPWKKYVTPTAVSPSKSRSASVLTGPHSPTPLIPTSKPGSPSRAQAAAAQASPLPVAAKDSQGNIERWFRYENPDCPGIIIDSHQSKHVDGALFGIYGGRRGDGFRREDCTEERLKSMLDELLMFEELNFLNSAPTPDHSTSLLTLNTSGNKKIPYDTITISSIVFCKERNAWCLHFFPRLPPRD